MGGLKIIYYGFGAFIGFICGTLINLIFYWVEKSGNPVFGSLIKNYGDLGRFFVEWVNVLPYFGMALGVVMVKILFHEQWEKEERE